MYQMVGRKSKMDDHRDTIPTDSTAAPKAKWTLRKAIVICVITGGAYGVAIGAILGTIAGSAKLIGSAAAIMAAICTVGGAQYGFFFGHVNRLHFGRLFVGSVAAVLGAILGGFFGIVATMPLGAIIGAVGGGFFGRFVAQQNYRFRNGLLGGFVGACLGALVLALRRNEVLALPGAIWGLGIGVVGGPILFLSFTGTLNSLPHTHSEQ